MGDVSGDIYIHGGLPQSRYCSTCAHYQTLSGSSIGGNCSGSARVPVHTRYRTPPRMRARTRGCDKHITLADWARSALGAAVLRDRRSRARSRKKANP